MQMQMHLSGSGRWSQSLTQIDNVKIVECRTGVWKGGELWSMVIGSYIQKVHSYYYSTVCMYYYTEYFVLHTESSNFSWTLGTRNAFSQIRGKKNLVQAQSSHSRLIDSTCKRAQLSSLPTY
jgi:hypothetical protein